MLCKWLHIFCLRIQVIDLLADAGALFQLVPCFDSCCLCDVPQNVPETQTCFSLAEGSHGNRQTSGETKRDLGNYFITPPTCSQLDKSIANLKARAFWEAVGTGEEKMEERWWLFSLRWDPLAGSRERQTGGCWQRLGEGGVKGSYLCEEKQLGTIKVIRCRGYSLWDERRLQLCLRCHSFHPASVGRSWECHRDEVTGRAVFDDMPGTKRNLDVVSTKLLQLLLMPPSQNVFHVNVT